jgi:glycosyltransferase involved in cell wall biosynthesis
MEEKGMTEAIEAVHRFNEKNKKNLLLEIWGPIDKSYKAEFEALLEKYKSDVEYKGIVDYSKSVETLTNHLALLFPTHWDGEGFPGTIVDAYAAGVPVIASDWNANAELINNFETGWVYPNERVKNLDESLEWVAGHLDEMLEMRQKCRDKAKEFMPTTWICKIVTLIEGEECYDKGSFADS